MYAETKETAVTKDKSPTPATAETGGLPPLTVRTISAGSVSSRVFSLAGPSDTPGPVFVLLHGIGASHRYYRRLQAVLARHGDTHAIDLPGFGATTTPDQRMSVAGYGGVIAGVLEAIGTGPVVVIGHSMGTQFATELAVQRPDLVSNVVLLGPVVDPARRTVLQQAMALGLDSLRESPRGNAIVFSDYIRSGLRWYLTELRVMMSYPLEARLGHVTRPVLVVRGSKDPIAPRQWCQQLADIPGQGQFLEIAGQPHMVQHGAPDRTAAAILAAATIQDSYGPLVPVQ
ncbi:alpha/beta hydrolase [Arthrobacter sp. KFRI-F3372]|uniref:alpha/beta fold hydrolase n=1 Tax=Micrococcaceae TaxID=1268 RepID=UPI00278716FA|nr:MULTISPECIES: alpha/beta hydrolase [Micrococcaceae]MDP9988998.1 pimeloyl-ACP methyl ester carboxylesterase [Arthrobacter oryzae]MEE2523898.1 alpha/beta hydrolase [Pseudarthrobacter sp. J47]MEE2530328.1 alpha/beta hydrolase [Pseudarthrobacter sp. J75]WHP61065.1 alpha/beta hydrolase [Arthrobacter sp. KFRI-F3372]